MTGIPRLIWLTLLCVGVFAASGLANAGPPKRQDIKVGVSAKMDAALFIPDGAGPFPTILLMHTSSGMSSADLQYCGRLAEQGYICVAPYFLAAYGISNATRRLSFTKEAMSITRDFIATIDMLNHLPQAKAGSVGAVGFSNGGFFALILASMHKVKAGVSYYGALDGARTQPDLMPFSKRFTATSAPVLVLAGDSDSTIGMAPVRKLEQILIAANAPYELKIYPATEHSFDRVMAGGNYAAAQDAWTRTLGFLAANLR